MFSFWVVVLGDAEEGLLEAVRRSVRLWPVSPRTAVQLINRSENTTFRLDDPEGPCLALRVYRSDYNGRAAIASELAWIAALRRDRVLLADVMRWRLNLWAVPSRAEIWCAGSARWGASRHVCMRMRRGGHGLGGSRGGGGIFPPCSGLMRRGGLGGRLGWMRRRLRCWRGGRR